jgi:hypothetical protein
MILLPSGRFPLHFEDHLSGQTCDDALAETRSCNAEPCPAKDCKLRRSAHDFSEDHGKLCGYGSIPIDTFLVG